MLLNFNTQMMQVLNEALALVPYGRSAPVIAEINRQVKDIEASRKASEEKQRQEEIERAIAESKKSDNDLVEDQSDDRSYYDDPGERQDVIEEGGKCAAE